MTSLLFGNNIISSLQQVCKPVIHSHIPHFRGCLDGGGPALLVGLAFFTEIRTSELYSLSKFIFVYMGGELTRDLA